MADKKFNIFFSAAVRGYPPDTEHYSAVMAHLSAYGKVLTEHMGNREALSLREENFTDATIFGKHKEWLAEADVLVAEVTRPSLGVGYEIAEAKNMGLPVLCVYREVSGQRLSADIAGNDRIRVEKYGNAEDLEKILKDFFSGLTKKSR